MYSGKRYTTCNCCKSLRGYWTPDGKLPLCDTCRQAEKHRYYCGHRPPGYATIPDRWYDYEAWMPGREVEGMGGWNWLGWVEYIRPLTNKEMYKWELIAADREPREAYREWYRNR